MKKTINHPKLGGNVVEGFPQRKPNKYMDGMELLKKAAKTSAKKKSVVK